MLGIERSLSGKKWRWRGGNMDLSRGGTATFDDFHGPTEWDVFQREMERVLIELARVSRQIRLRASS